MVRAWIEVEWDDGEPGVVEALVRASAELLLGVLVDAGVPECSVVLTLGVPEPSEVSL